MLKSTHLYEWMIGELIITHHNNTYSIQVINFSTGRIIRKLALESEVTAIDTDHTGQFIFAGDSQVFIYFSDFLA
jgi:hypothetical protein